MTARIQLLTQLPQGHLHTSKSPVEIGIQADPIRDRIDIVYYLRVSYLQKVVKVDLRTAGRGGS
jgi:hypothetical protein